jgi:hypothetical protein
MEVQIRQGLPDKYKLAKGSTYETRYIYTGVSRYDAEKKTLTRIEERDGKMYMTMTPCEDSVFSRGYHTELVRVTVFSESPRIWKEELSPHEVYFYKQVA